MKLKIVLEKGEDEYIVAHVPALRSCVSQGKTKQEALKNIKEAIELYLESLREDGLSIPTSDVEVVVKDIEVSV